MLTRSMPWKEGAAANDALVTREWLVTNGLGGYASGTVAGVTTRRYHGLLVAAMPAPLGRMMMLNHLSEQIRLADGTVVLLSGEERVPQLTVHGAPYLKEFRLENGLPVWTYQIDGVVLEKRLFMPRYQNTVHVTYRMLKGKDTIRLKLMPSVHFRSHDAPVSQPLPKTFELHVVDDQFELSAGNGLPVLRLTTYGTRPAFTIERRYLREMLFRIEARRGYESIGEMWSPGYFRFDLGPGLDATVVASTEEWKTVLSMEPEDAFKAENRRRERLLAAAPSCAQDGVGGELVLAADQFVIRPIGRSDDIALAKATGDEGRTVIAGYHWFTDWGRDTMISLEGLALSTGRRAEGGYILRTFAQHIRDGLIPNLFPEGQEEGLYHTADATMWFFHALDRYVRVTGDTATLREILPKLIDIYDHHVAGTRYRIGMDQKDGLLSQGQEGYQLTWMDAKMGDWVVTPRRGKAVEINALWYNAVRLLEKWTAELEGAGAAARYSQRAAQIRESFNRRFWHDEEHGLFDVVDGEHGNDAAVRPNQLFAISLPHPVLDRSRWEAVLKVAEKKLLTPVGLRSLSPDDKEYKPSYHGDLRTRDAAYHQGTVWGWLIGPYVDAWLKVHPDHRKREARALLSGLVEHLNDGCIGSVSEVFDAESPFSPRGCCAQAWSVAELLRCWVLTADECEGAEGPGSP